QDAAEPADQFPRGPPAELMKVPAGLQESFLHHVRRIRPRLQVEIELRTRLDVQVIAVNFQESAERLTAPAQGLGQEFVRVRLSVRVHGTAASLIKLDRFRGPNVTRPALFSPAAAPCSPRFPLRESR